MTETEPITSRYGMNDAHLWELVASVWYWRGQFFDPQTAIDWVHKNGSGKVYEINNIPPPTSNSFLKGKPMADPTDHQPQHAVPRHNAGTVGVSRISSAGLPKPKKIRKPSSFALQAADRLMDLQDAEEKDMEDGKVDDLR